MSNINFNITHVPKDITAVILQDVITGTGTLECRLVCTDWKQITDERVFKLIARKLQSEFTKIPGALGLKNIVITFIDSMNPKNITTLKCDLDKVKKFGTTLATTIGGCKPKVIASADQITQLTQKDTNLHILWDEIKKEIRNAPEDLHTCEQISLWMHGNKEALTSCTSLFIYKKNNLTSIPQEIKYLSNLQLIDLFKNKIKNIPPEIGDLKNLEELNVTYSELESLPREIKNCPQLKIIRFENNKLESFPQSILECSLLQVINGENNYLQNVPREIGNLTRLKRLWLSNNNLQKLPPELKKCSDLHSLRLEKNLWNINEEIKKDLNFLKQLQNLLNGEFWEDNKDGEIVQVFKDDEIVAVFKQLSLNSQNKLAAYFYDRHQEAYVTAGKDHWDCAKYTLLGDEYYRDCIPVNEDTLSSIVVKMQIELLNDDEILVNEHLSTLL